MAGPTPGIPTGRARVSIGVRAEGVEVDLVVSCLVTVADLLPELVDRLGIAGWQAGVRVVTTTGRELGWEETLADVPDGTLLQLVPTPEPASGEDDVAEAVAASVAGQVVDERWVRSLVALVSTWLVALGAVALVSLGPDVRSATVLVVAAALTAAFAVTDAGRVAGGPTVDRTGAPSPPAVQARLALAVGLGGTAVATAPLHPDQQALLGVLALVAAGVAGVNWPPARAVGVGCLVAAWWAALALVLVQFVGWSGTRTAAVVVAAVAATRVVSPWWVVPRAAAGERAADRGDGSGVDRWEVWTGAAVVAALTEAFAGWFLAGAGAPGAVLLLSTLVVSGGRSRPRRVLWIETIGWVGALAAFTAHATRLAFTGPGPGVGDELTHWALALLAAAGGLASWGRLRRARPSLWRRAGELLWWLGVVALVPAMLWAGGWAG